MRSRSGSIKYMHERVIGYSLLCFGIFIMMASVFLVYALFTHQIQPFRVFRDDLIQPAKKQSVSLSNLMTDPQALTEMQSQLISQVLGKQINSTMNIGATVFLMYFVMLFGFRLSTLGIQLVRPIQVKLNTVKDELSKTTNIPPKPSKD